MSDRSRGFALPIVILLIVVAMIMLTLMLERQSVQLLNVKRQLNGYESHHASRGMQEVIDGWLTGQGSEPLAALLDVDGRAFELELQDGTLLEVFFHDAQGLLYREPGEAVGADRDEQSEGDEGPDSESVLANAAARLYEDVGADTFMELTRTEGPEQLSVLGVTAPVLRAVLAELTGSEHVDHLVDPIILAQKDGSLIRGDVLPIQVLDGLDRETRTLARQVLTARPRLWRVVVDVRADGSALRSPARRFEGQLLLAAAAGSSRASTSPFQRTGLFLWWKEVDPSE